MKYEFINKIQAEEKFNFLVRNDFSQTESLSEDYTTLRQKLLVKIQSITKDSNSQTDKNKKKYLFDLKFGLALYEETNKIFKLKTNMSLASNENFWIYINLVVIPDVLFDRWHDTENKRGRFYSHTKRNYTNSLWWYIHLGWQGTSDLTENTLSGFNTDTLVQVNERAGSGYNEQLYREILLQSSRLVNNRGVNLRRIMVLNTFYIKTIQPEYYKNGISGYVSMLLQKVIE